MQALGHPLRPDQNAAWEDGLFTTALALSTDKARIPVSIAYLTDEVRRRSNLSIVTCHVADRVLIAEGRATGAILVPIDGGPPLTAMADEVIVSCGAIYSPALLMRSRIGSGETLSRHGTEVLLDKPDVGRSKEGTDMRHPLVPPDRLTSGQKPLCERHRRQIENDPVSAAPTNWTRYRPTLPAGFAGVSTARHALWRRDMGAREADRRSVGLRS